LRDIPSLKRGDFFSDRKIAAPREPREDNAAYIAHWLKVLKDDNQAIFAAASHTQRAADFLNRLQPLQAMEAPAANEAA
jgi:antirestriction protein ArdC